ncbi:unnamed protein product [Cutaneotrichosporon oleaginosum]
MCQDEHNIVRRHRLGPSTDDSNTPPAVSEVPPRPRRIRFYFGDGKGGNNPNTANGSTGMSGAAPVNSNSDFKNDDANLDGGASVDPHSQRRGDEITEEASVHTLGIANTMSFSRLSGTALRSHQMWCTVRNIVHHRRLGKPPSEALIVVFGIDSIHGYSAARHLRHENWMVQGVFLIDNSFVRGTNWLRSTFLTLDLRSQGISVFTSREFEKNDHQLAPHLYGAFIGPEWPPPAEKPYDKSSLFLLLKLRSRGVKHVIYCISESLRSSSPEQHRKKRKFAANCTAEGIPLTQLLLGLSYHDVIQDLDKTTQPWSFSRQHSPSDPYLPYFAPEQTGCWATSVFDMPHLIGQDVHAVGERLCRANIIADLLKLQANNPNNDVEMLSAEGLSTGQQTKPASSTDDLEIRGTVDYNKCARVHHAWEFYEWFTLWDTTNDKAATAKRQIDLVELQVSILG